MAAVPTRKSRRVDSRYRNILIVGVEQVYRFSESEPKIECFYPTDKFLERCEMGYYGERKDLLNSFHISDIFNKLSIVLVPEIFEEDQDKELILSIGLLRVFAGIWFKMSRLYYRCGSLDKPDIPACRSLNCLLT